MAAEKVYLDSKGTAEMDMFSSLPENVVVEILSRLPVDLLLSYKRLGKSWSAIIGEPQFAAKQLLNRSCSPSANSDNNCCVLLRRQVYTGGKTETFLSLVKYDDKGQAGDVSIALVFQPYSEVPDPDCSIKITSSCDGIICLRFPKNKVAIANPGIGEVKVLPRSCIRIPDPDDKDSSLSDAGAVFGYDPKSESYKVVRLWDIKRNGLVVPPPRVEIYTLGTDSWKEIDRVSPFGGSVVHNHCLEGYFNGACYWWALDSENRKQMLLSFDLSDELFKYISLPESHHGIVECLVERNGALALILCRDEGVRAKSFDIWVMDESCVEGSYWTKVLTLGTFSKGKRPLVFLTGNQLLMKDLKGSLVSYNLSTKKIKKHREFRGQKRIRKRKLDEHRESVEYKKYEYQTVYVQAEVYKRSLLSVRGGN